MVLADDGAHVLCENGSARILPTYAALEKVSVGSIDLGLVVKEITEREEFCITTLNHKPRNQPV